MLGAEFAEAVPAITNDTKRRRRAACKCASVLLQFLLGCSHSWAQLWRSHRSRDGFAHYDDSDAFAGRTKRFKQFIVRRELGAVENEFEIAGQLS